MNKKGIIAICAILVIFAVTTVLILTGNKVNVPKSKQYIRNGGKYKDSTDSC